MSARTPRMHRSSAYPKPISVSVQASSHGLLLSPVMSTPSYSYGEPISPRSNLEAVVKRLLHAIQRLLHYLTLWSQGSVTEEEVSDVYVRLGSEFNATVMELRNLNIDTSDLMPVTSELRSLLESCLSEEADPKNLGIYLPEVKRVVANLLKRLKEKQQLYRRIPYLPLSPSVSYSANDYLSSDYDSSSSP